VKLLSLSRYPDFGSGGGSFLIDGPRGRVGPWELDMNDFERSVLMMLTTMLSVQGISLRLTHGNTEDKNMTKALDDVEELIVYTQNQVKELMT
jgi:hypothetical protein